MIWYGGGRLALESLREGWDWTVMGIPTAMLIGGLLVVLGALTIVGRHRRPIPPVTPPTAAPAA